MDQQQDLRDFVRARGGELSRAAFLLTGDRHAAEDLVQETYVALVRRWNRRGQVDAAPDVRRILYSRFIDGWRRHRLVEVPSRHPVEVNAGGDAAAAAVDRVALSRALMRLTPKQRAVLVLRFYEDLTEVQAAETLGISVSTVKSQVRVALQRLRDLAPDVVASFDVFEEVAE